MSGITLALLSAFLWATNDILNKKSIIKGYSENFVLWIRFPIGAVLLLPLGIYFWSFNLSVLWTTFLWLPIEVMASVFFIKGIKFAPLSVGMPFFAFMPLFSAIFGYIFLGEKIETSGFLGIVLILLGSFVITGGSVTSFLKANRGSFFMLVSAVLFGMSAVIGKLAIVKSNPYFFSWYYCTVMTFGLIPLTGFKEIAYKKNYLNPLNLPMGVLFSSGMIAYSLALEKIPVSYTASVERLAIILDVIYGKIFFGEKIKKNFLGSILMVTGAVLLSL